MSKPPNFRKVDTCLNCKFSDWGNYSGCGFCSKYTEEEPEGLDLRLVVYPENKCDTWEVRE